MLYNLFENRDFVSVFAVALLAEGVDRNVQWAMTCYSGQQVALLAEGVDRNSNAEDWIVREGRSPSSRRAWIEMSSMVQM